ncbi:MAG TPA: DUF4124 domain-containing protein [Myxococcota bacterium]|nr:DUF4124 domain-containing protein [Myxococcota bacterium]
MRFTRSLALGCLLFATAALAEEAGAPPRIYRWIDENGVAHYTTDLERVPEELRDQPLRSETVTPNAPASTDAWLRQERIAEPPAPSGAAPAPGADRTSVLNARIAELRAAIEADEEMLKSELVDTSAAASNDTLKQVAERMPDRITELQKLEAERDALTKSAGQ